MNSSPRHLAITISVVCMVLVGCQSAAPSAIAPSSPPVQFGSAPPATAQPEVSLETVLAAVAAAAGIKAVPDDLVPPLDQAEADTEALPKDNCGAPTQSFPDTVFGECLYGDTTSTKRVALFGDSHAGMWSTSLHQAGLRGGWSLRVYEQGGCPAPRITFFKNDAPNTDCDTFREAAIKEIVRTKPDVIVVTSATFFQRTGRSSSEYATAAQWEPALEAVLKDLAASGAKLIVLGDLPVLSQPAPECLAAHEQDVAQCRTSSAKAFENVYHAQEAAAANAAGATYIDPSSWFCTDTCSPIVGRILVYRNQFHISATYAVYLSGAVQLAIGPIP